MFLIHILIEYKKKKKYEAVENFGIILNAISVANFLLFLGLKYMDHDEHLK
jgi:hypothetical protein